MDVSTIEEIKLSAETSRRIILSNDSNGLIGPVKKIYLHDSLFFLHHQQKMSIFKYDGSFYGNISSHGRADNEYLTMWYSWIKDSALYIHDMNGKKIMQYGFADGSIRNNELTERSRAFQALMPIGDRGFIGKLGFMGNVNTDSELGFYNNNYEFIQEIEPLVLNSGLWLGYPFSKFNDEVIYWRPFDRDIYSVNESLNFSVKYTLDFGDNNVPERDFQDDYEIIDFINKTPDKYVAGLFDVEETDDYVCLVFIYDKTKNIAVYSKNNNSTNIYRFSFEDGETLNTVIPYKDQIIVVSDRESESSIIYLIDIDNILEL
jgi:hypothetical protein